MNLQAIEKMGQEIDLDNKDIPESREVGKSNQFNNHETGDSYQKYLGLRNNNKPVNGNYLRLKEQKYTFNGPLRDYTYDGVISPNIIRKHTDPDTAIPTLRSGQYVKYSLPPSTQTETPESKNVGLVQLALQQYTTYKDRFLPPTQQAKTPA
jgi:hypothetical protein